MIGQIGTWHKTTHFNLSIYSLGYTKLFSGAISSVALCFKIWLLTTKTKSTITDSLISEKKTLNHIDFNFWYRTEHFFFHIVCIVFRDISTHKRQNAFLKIFSLKHLLSIYLFRNSNCSTKATDRHVVDVGRNFSDHCNYTFFS